jgi:hypothetical protein
MTIENIPPAELNIDTFKAQFQTGARAYLFYMEPSFPAAVGGDMTNPAGRFLVRSTSLPASKVASIPTPWQGFDFKSAGKRTYDAWEVTYVVDRRILMREKFLKWHDLVLDPATNKHALPDVYFKDQRVVMLNMETMQGASKYTLKYAYPEDVGAVALDYGSTEGFATFTVTWAYTYFLHEQA